MKKQVDEQTRRRREEKGLTPMCRETHMDKVCIREFPIEISSLQFHFSLFCMRKGIELSQLEILLCPQWMQHVAWPSSDLGVDSSKVSISGVTHQWFVNCAALNFSTSRHSERLGLFFLALKYYSD